MNRNNRPSRREYSREPSNGADQGNEPVYSRTYCSNGGIVNVALFENYVETKNGERLTYGLKVHRSYKDDKGEYQTVKGFQEGDIGHLLIGLSNAAAWIDSQQRQ